MIKRIFGMMFAFLASICLSAENYTLTVGENTLKSYQPANCTFTPESDGRVLIEAQEVFKVVYNDQVFEHQYTPATGYSYTYEIPDVKAGTSVTVSSDFVWGMSSKIRVTLFTDGSVVPVEVVGINPRAQSVFTWNSTGLVSVNFNKQVAIDAIQFVAGDYVLPITDNVHMDSSIGFNITDVLNDALSTGKLKSGDSFFLKISGLRDAHDETNLYNGTGELLIEYVAPYPQHGFKRAYVGETELHYLQDNDYRFLSYYAKDGQDGLFVFEFDEEIGSVSDVYITMGDLDLTVDGKYHRSQLPYTIEGTKLLVDARGKLRTLAVLFPSVVDDGEGNVYDTFSTDRLTLGIGNILDIHGNAFQSDIPGSVGSYYFTMGYQELNEEAYLDGDNVSDGDVVKAGQEISLWLSNADIQFESLSITYSSIVEDEMGGEPTQESHVVYVKDFVIEKDPIQGVIIRFLMPDLPGVADGTNIRVSLENANSADGMPHTLYIVFVAGFGNGSDTPVEDGIQQLNLQKAGRTYLLNGMSDNHLMQHKIVVKNGKKVVR